MKRALVTLAVGEKYLKNFEKHCLGLWKDYAQNHNLDVHIFKSPLDLSIKAKSRSPAWQKCLILSQNELSRYDQVAWVDSDILINPNSPNIFENVPISMIGAVDEFAIPNISDHKIIIERLRKKLSQKKKESIPAGSAGEYHRKFGFENCELDSVVQTGVMVLSPKYHKDLLEYVYHEYDDKGASYWHYEMRPLSYEIQKNKVVHWINPKFNMLWEFIKQLHYKFLEVDHVCERSLKYLNLKSFPSLRSKCITQTFNNNYFLHFAGCSSEIKYCKH